MSNDIRNAMRPKVTSLGQKGTTTSGFVTGSDRVENSVVTEHRPMDITPVPNPTPDTTPQAIDSIENDVVQSYTKFLSERGIDEPIYMSILDMLLSGQVVLWNFELLGKIPVTFRVRPKWVDKYLVEELEKQRPSNMARFTDIVGTINLAGSLESYGDKNFRTNTVEEMKIVTDFLDTLPFVIQNKLVDELAIFDRVIVVATSEWAVKNFTKTR